MGPTKRTLAIVAFTTTLVSCASAPIPGNTPISIPDPLPIYATTALMPLAHDLITFYRPIDPRLDFTITPPANHAHLLDGLYNRHFDYFISSHLPADSPLWAAPIGSDAIIIIAHPNSGLSSGSLTLDQLRSIYLGRLRNWSEVGGIAAPIIVFSREDGSGTRAEFERRLLGQRPVTPTARLATSSQHMIDMIHTTTGSIGYISIGYLDRLTPELSPLALDGIHPTRDTIASGIYPLRSVIYIIGRTEATSPYRELIAWLQSPTGQAIIALHYIPLTSNN